MPKRRPAKGNGCSDGCGEAEGSRQLGIGLVAVLAGVGDVGSILLAFLAAVSFHGMRAPLGTDAAPLGDNATLITTATTATTTAAIATTMVDLQLGLRLDTNQVGIGQMGTTLSGDDEPQQQQQQQQRQTEGDIWSEALDTATLTKGFSIPTYLPPFPEFIPADLPQRQTNATEEKRNGLEPGSGKSFSNEPQSRLHAYNSEQKELQLKREKQLAKERASGYQRQLSLPSLNATVQAGQHAYLPCQLHQHSNKPLSWVRLRDEHIIAVDHTTFINDARFASLLQQSTANASTPITNQGAVNASTSAAAAATPESGINSNSSSSGLGWTLQIKYVKLEDAGWYECQLATEPKMSAKVQLFVITPRTELIGDQQRFVKAGSKVELHCIVRGTLEAPKYIFWYRGEEQVISDAEAENENKPSSKAQNGWHTQIDRNIFGSTEHNRNTIGSLIIPLVRKTHSGNYTCEPENSAAVSMQLHVLSGEYSASAIMSTASGLHRHGHGYSSLHQWLIFLLVALNKT